MHAGLELALFAFLIIAAIVAIQVKDLLTAVVTLAAFSFITALIEVVMGAVDVGFTEAAVGAGITGVLFIVAVFRTRRDSLD